jgi:hypothetical protein
MNELYFTSDFLVLSRRYGLLEKASFLAELLTQVSSFYHYHLSSPVFIQDYLESNGEVYGNQELDEFREFYRYLSNLDFPDFSLLLPPKNRLDRPEYFMARVFYRFPLKEWTNQLIWLIDHYKRFQEIKLNLDHYPEDFLHQLLFEWKVEEEFDRLEPLFAFFRLSPIYV